MKYLGKRKLFKIAKELGVVPASIVSCEHHKGYGLECLVWHGYYEMYKLINLDGHVYLELYKYNDQYGRYSCYKTIHYN